MVCIEVEVDTENCICPSASYTCTATSATRMMWKTNELRDPFIYDVRKLNQSKHQERDGVRVNFSIQNVTNNQPNLFAELHIIDVSRWNGTIFTCQADNTSITKKPNITICITGKYYYR